MDEDKDEVRRERVKDTSRFSISADWMVTVTVNVCAYLRRVNAFPRRWPGAVLLPPLTSSRRDASRSQTC